MIQSIQKIIKIGSSGGVTIPAKEMKRQNMKFGDDVEIIVRSLDNTSSEDQKVINAAKSTLNDYKKDFQNLAKK
ncbi:MAG TPA: AbrB/MazE/SpoVT family DNA-binding domain-containing protein [Candidatus Saccharimonadales bacterium]|nr:AbrB/MazE/SpoVT family DNA-binding domain-containing protein [Candidatus Saccharimonadales bacterium]